MWPFFYPADDVTQQKSYGLETITAAFNEIVGSSQIDFDFCQGGCQQRAQVISMLLNHRYNIEHSKIWLFAPAALYFNDSRTLFIEDKNQLSPNNTVNWNYHVAPAILVNDNGAMNFYIFDPCINNTGPLLMDTWFKSIGNSDVGQYSFYYPIKYFFNCLNTRDGKMTNIFDGTFTEYANPDKDNLIMEKGLAVNDTAMAVYHGCIKPMMERGLEEEKLKLADLKAIFGNATALDMLLSQNISAYTYNTVHRHVITYYSDIILQAKRIFNERLVFWTKFVNTLL